MRIGKNVWIVAYNTSAGFPSWLAVFATEAGAARYCKRVGDGVFRHLQPFVIKQELN
jgi:hypothetical protein